MASLRKMTDDELRSEIVRLRLLGDDKQLRDAELERVGRENERLNKFAANHSKPKRAKKPTFKYCPLHATELSRWQFVSAQPDTVELADSGERLLIHFPHHWQPGEPIETRVAAVGVITAGYVIAVKRAARRLNII